MNWSPDAAAAISVILVIWGIICAWIAPTPIIGVYIFLGGIALALIAYAFLSFLVRH